MASPGGGAAQIQTPAIALLVVGILDIVGAIGLMGYGVVMMFAAPAIVGANPNISAKDAEAMSGMAAMGGGMYACIGVIALLVSALVLFSAMKMKKLESYPLAMAGSIVAMIPCLSPCCIAGLPIGIWCLMVLNKPEVKSAFR